MAIDAFGGVANADLQTRTRDPLTGFRFRVIIDRVGKFGFSTISGLREETEVAEYREGTFPSTPIKIPGITTYDNVTFERGVGADDALNVWRRQIFAAAARFGSSDGLADSSFRKNIKIQLYSKGDNVTSGIPSVEWQLLNAWPVALELSDFDASSSDVLIETLEVAHEGLVRRAGKAFVSSPLEAAQGSTGVGPIF